VSPTRPSALRAVGHADAVGHLDESLRLQDEDAIPFTTLCLATAAHRLGRRVDAEQWLYVVNGSGVAIEEGERVELREGTLVLIERGERHELRNTGETPLLTLNVYVPPAYTKGGDELPAGKP
jgi:quercetin dioxygenase-like cupin family protein